MVPSLFAWGPCTDHKVLGYLDIRVTSDRGHANPGAHVQATATPIQASEARV